MWNFSTFLFFISSLLIVIKPFWQWCRASRDFSIIHGNFHSYCATYQPSSSFSHFLVNIWSAKGSKRRYYLVTFTTSTTTIIEIRRDGGSISKIGVKNLIYRNVCSKGYFSTYWLNHSKPPIPSTRPIFFVVGYWRF